MHPNSQSNSHKKVAGDTSNMTITITCQSGLESLVRRESQKLGLTNTSGQDRLVSGTGNTDALYRLLMGSRFANRIYIELAKRKVADFDTLYDTLVGLPWKHYISGRENIVIDASSSRSLLSSVPTIQSIGKKAIFATLHTPNITNGIEVHILLLIVDNTLRVLLDVTGDPLHKRGYRTRSGDAPIKENLAAALVAFVGWRYKSPLWDPFCGSGTIVIEAAMIARNISPGLGRHFRVESLPFHDRGLWLRVKRDLESQSYPSGSYHIIASDIDDDMVSLAKEHARKVGVYDDITFSTNDFLSTKHQSAIIVTNPPYGERLQQDNIEEIYHALENIIAKNNGGFITSYPIENVHQLFNKKLLNGSQECRFWYKKQK